MYVCWAQVQNLIKQSLEILTLKLTLKCQPYLDNTELKYYVCMDHLQPDLAMAIGKSERGEKLFFLPSCLTLHSNRPTITYQNSETYSLK